MQHEAAIVLHRAAAINLLVLQAGAGLRLARSDAQFLEHDAEIEPDDRLVEDQAHGVIFVVTAHINDAVGEFVAVQPGHGDQQAALIGDMIRLRGHVRRGLKGTSIPGRYRHVGVFPGRGEIGR